MREGEGKEKGKRRTGGGGSEEERGRVLKEVKERGREGRKEGKEGGRRGGGLVILVLLRQTTHTLYG